MRNRYKADVVVIGGGVIGTSVAYHLAKERVKVIIVEKNDLASGASGACCGFVGMQTRKPGLHLRIALESKKRFETLKDELPVDIEYHNDGGMFIIQSDSEMDTMRQYVSERRNAGLEVKILDTKEARELEPFLSEEILGATFSPMDANVNPYRLVQGYAKGAHEYGSQIMTGTRARGIGISNGRIQNVETNRGTIETPVVVNAAGAYAAEVGRLVGLEIPVVPRRGQIIVTERTDTPKIKSALLSANYFAAKFNPDLAQKNTDFTNIEQMENGTILLGCSLEFAGFDRTTTRETLRGIAERASKIVPGLRNTQIIRSYAGLRPYSPDGLPIMGPVKSMPGFFVATGHSGDGICLSAITGMLLAQQIVHGQSEISLNEFSLDRFQQSKTALG